MLYFWLGNVGVELKNMQKVSKVKDSDIAFENWSTVFGIPKLSKNTDILTPLLEKKWHCFIIWRILVH